MALGKAPSVSEGRGGLIHACFLRRF